MVQSMVEILQNCVAFSEYKNFKNFFANGKMKKNCPQKLLIIVPNVFFQSYQPAQNQLKSQILFHENCFSRYLCLMTLDTGDGR